MRAAAACVLVGVVVLGGCTPGKVAGGPASTATTTTLAAVSVEEAAICRAGEAAHAVVKGRGDVMSTHDLDEFIKATNAAKGVPMRAEVAATAGIARERADVYLQMDFDTRMQGVDKVIAEADGVPPPSVPSEAERADAAYGVMVGLARLIEACGPTG